MCSPLSIANTVSGWAWPKGSERRDRTLDPSALRMSPSLSRAACWGGA